MGATCRALLVRLTLPAVPSDSELHAPAGEGAKFKSQEIRAVGENTAFSESFYILSVINLLIEISLVCYFGILSEEKSLQWDKQ